MGIRLQLLKKFFPGVCAVMVLFLGMPAGNVRAEEKFPIVYEDAFDGEEAYVTLIKDEEDYTVESGDSLWKIAEKLWGDGNDYMELADANKNQIVNPDRIYPGETLKVSRSGRLIRKEKRGVLTYTGKYLMDTPYGWTVGVTQSGDAWTNYALSGDGVIACLIKDKEEETVKTVQDFEECMGKIEDYAEKNYPDQVSELCFEHYRTENQNGDGGELYLYSYIWHISPEYPDLTYQVCAGLKLTDHVQAEFVGYAHDYDIHGTVRYVAATFEEDYDPGSGTEFTVNDTEMDIQPQVEWELKGMFNSFAYLDEYFGSALERVTGASDETSSSDTTSSDKWLNGYPLRPAS